MQVSLPKKYVSNKTTNICRTKAKQKTDKLPQVTVQVTVQVTISFPIFLRFLA